MSTFDPRIDSYIEKSADFAKPTLTHIREIVHKAFPQILETIKWGMPFFDHKGTVCNMAGFKQHCAFGFWKSSLLPDPYNLLKQNTVDAMGQLGKISSIADLPSDEILIEYIQNAVKLNEQGSKVAKPSKARTELIVPEFLIAILDQNPAAKTAFDNFSYSHKKEYIQWFNEAKTEETKQKRIATALEWLSEGKPRHWKYDQK